MSVEHVIVLMLENNSFDRMLGGLLPPRPDPATPGGGVKGAAQHFSNIDHTTGKNYTMSPTSAREMPEDPGHEYSDTIGQIANNSSGFVANFVSRHPSSPATERQEIMSYYGDGDLPVLHALAKNFTICDRWFSSMPGPTWPNRLFLYSGTSLGFTDMNALHQWDQKTLFDQLSADGISWRLYYGDVSSTAILLNKPDPYYMYSMRYFFQHAAGPAADFPAFSLIEPAYFLSPNDQHPPHDVFRGEALVADVYNALRSNDELWRKSLLVITYDEHGGFFDHIDPPAAIPPDDRRDGSGFNWDRLGVRVPAVLVSPWFDQGVITETFDHTSLVRFVLDLNGLATDWLGARVPVANTFAPFMRTTPRNTTKVLPHITPPAYMAPVAQARLTDHQAALADMTRVLARDIDDKSAALPLSRRAGSPNDEMQQAINRFEAYLMHSAKQAPRRKADESKPMSSAAAEKSKKRPPRSRRAAKETATAPRKRRSIPA